jgi:hypothetical protein
MTEESIPELLARLEREHVRNPIGQGAAVGERCVCGERWPCQSDPARLVAHARSLEAANERLRWQRDQSVEDCDTCLHNGAIGCENHAPSWSVAGRAALGEAQ